ncbi:MAG: hypothetical protein CMH30_08990 [Micavibrio sp.]|nr:hypothetical protein [Micavibrio sp.]|tara:strand:- start:409 stop:1482 length:1074 start_codon:yes stop_codon:yes gene_type:complete
MSGLEKWFFDTSVKFEFNAKERLRFYSKLSQLLDNGVALDMALSQLQKVAAKSRGSVLGQLYARWRRSVANGVNFGKCMGPYIPSSEAILIETGADSGHLIMALKNAETAVEQQGKVKKAIVTASAYPAVLVMMLIGALVLSSYQVIPTFAEIIPVEEWTGVSKLMANVSSFIREFGFFILLTAILAIIGISYALPRWSGMSRLPFENIVPFNFYRMWQGSAFLLSVSSLMNAGVKLDEMSLTRLARSADPYLAVRIKAVKKWMSSGANFGDALQKAGYKFPDEGLIADMQIYAQLRGFEHNISKITFNWVDDLIEEVNVSMKVVNTVVLFMIAITIGMLIMAFFGVFQQINASTSA